jgi:tetratricopeptide (TPR) repeat protein
MAILQARFELGLDALGRGDVASARESFKALGKASSRLVPEDRQTLDFANAILAVLGSDKPEAAARTLSTQLTAPRYATPAASRMRDIGQGYVAWAWLRAGRVVDARKALERVKDRKSLGPALDALFLAADDTEARIAFAARDFATAARLWEKLVASDGRNDGFIHNLAAARFMAGQGTDAETTWRGLIDNRAAISEALYNLGNALGRRGEHREAFELLSRFGRTSAPEAPLGRERAAIKAKLFGFGATP